MRLPKLIIKPEIAPIIIHGSKLKLIPWMFQNMYWNGNGTFIEPFLGSGVVFLNMKPKKAILNDKNPHTIRLYQDLYEKKLTLNELKKDIYNEYEKIKIQGKQRFYEISDQFNSNPNSKQLLLLNAFSFQNLMRFNNSGKYNSSFNLRDQNPMNVINRVSGMLQAFSQCDIQFYNEDFRDILPLAKENDFVYLDPPYIAKGGYLKTFTEDDIQNLISWINSTQAGFGFSHWYKDENGINKHLNTIDPSFPRLYKTHRYSMGDKCKKNTNKKLNQNVIEILVISKKSQVDEKIEYENQAKITNYHSN